MGRSGPKEMMETALTDEELLDRAARGDEPSFTRLYRRRQGAIYRFVLQLTGSRMLAEEVTQEVFLIMIQKASDFDVSKGALKSYLCGVARNLVLRYRREELQWDDVDWQEESPSGALPVRPDPLAVLERSEIVMSVRRAVLALPQPYRETVVLCDLHELTYAEAATILGCSVETIRSRLHRGRVLLLNRIPKMGTSTQAEPGELRAAGDQSREDTGASFRQTRSWK